jgi:hypothetical protein
MNNSNISISGFCSRKVRASCREAKEVVAQLMGILLYSRQANAQASPF